MLGFMLGNKNYFLRLKSEPIITIGIAKRSNFSASVRGLARRLRLLLLRDLLLEVRLTRFRRFSTRPTIFVIDWRL